MSTTPSVSSAFEQLHMQKRYAPLPVLAADCWCHCFDYVNTTTPILQVMLLNKHHYQSIRSHEKVWRNLYSNNLRNQIIKLEEENKEEQASLQYLIQLKTRRYYTDFSTKSFIAKRTREVKRLQGLINNQEKRAKVALKKVEANVTQTLCDYYYEACKKQAMFIAMSECKAKMLIHAATLTEPLFAMLPSTAFAETTFSLSLPPESNYNIEFACAEQTQRVFELSDTLAVINSTFARCFRDEPENCVRLIHHVQQFDCFSIGHFNLTRNRLQFSESMAKQVIEKHTTITTSTQSSTALEEVGYTVNAPSMLQLYKNHFVPMARTLIHEKEQAFTRECTKFIPVLQQLVHYNPRPKVIGKNAKKRQQDLSKEHKTLDFKTRIAQVAKSLIIECFAFGTSAELVKQLLPLAQPLFFANGVPIQEFFTYDYNASMYWELKKHKLFDCMQEQVQQQQRVNKMKEDLLMTPSNGTGFDFSRIVRAGDWDIMKDMCNNGYCEIKTQQELQYFASSSTFTVDTLQFLFEKYPNIAPISGAYMALPTPYYLINYMLYAIPIADDPDNIKRMLNILRYLYTVQKVPVAATTTTSQGAQNDYRPYGCFTLRPNSPIEYFKWLIEETNFNINTTIDGVSFLGNCSWNQRVETLKYLVGHGAVFRGGNTVPNFIDCIIGRMMRETELNSTKQEQYKFLLTLLVQKGYTISTSDYNLKMVQQFANHSEACATAKRILSEVLQECNSSIQLGWADRCIVC